MCHFYKDIIESVYKTGKFSSKEYRLRVRFKRFKFFKQVRIPNNKRGYIVSEDVCDILGLNYNEQYVVKHDIA